MIADDEIVIEVSFTAQDCYQMVEECTLFEREAHLAGDKEVLKMHLGDVDGLHRLVTTRCDWASQCLQPTKLYDTTGIRA